MRVGAQLLLTFLLNASWQIALVVAFASVCDWLLRGTAARYRHGLWIAALSLALVLPLWSPVRALATRNTNPEPAPITATPIFVTSVYSPELDTLESPSTVYPAPPAPAPKRRGFLSSGIHLSKPLAVFLVVLYGLFVLWRAGQLWRAWSRTKLIVRTAFECEFSAQVSRIIEECQAATGVPRVRILCSKSVPVPSTVGVLSPLIILPEGLLHDVDEEVLTSAIGHELVHVSRRDYLANLICEFIYLPLSFHPGAALVRRRIKQTRELCCDESVAAKLLKAEIYARSLVRLIGEAPLGRRLAIDTTIGIGESDILEVRIMSLLKRSGLTAGRKRLLLIAAALLLAVPCVAATSFALTLDIDRENPAFDPGFPEKQSQEKMERRDQERERVELQRAEKELKEQARLAPASQRATIEAQLREVQRNLELHERLLQQYNQSRTDGEKRLEDLRAQLSDWEKNGPANEARMKEARAEIATLERLSSEKRERGTAELEAVQGDRKARVIYRVEPKYTEDARANNISGSVVLGLTVDHQGLPQNIQVKKSLYPSLDQSSIEAAQKMRFEPAMKNGQPVSMYITVEMNFMREQGQFDAERALVDRMKQEQAERGGSGPLELRRKQSFEGRSQEERAKVQAALTRDATLSMDRAIQIAISQVPGKVLACSLGRDGDKVFYHVIIITADGEKSTTTYVWVSATDGQILKTEKEERREERKEETSLAREGVAPISGGVLNDKATSMPVPAYPVIARAAHASGSVTVQVLIDEAGNVVAAHAVSGHPLLQAAAVAAARQASFTPTRLSGEPVKVSGALVYNFVAQ